MHVTESIMKYPPAFTIALSLACACSTEGSAQVTAEDARNVTEAYWNSLDSITFVCTETASGPDGSKHTLQYKIFVDNSKKSIQVENVDNKTIIIDHREDGRHAYNIDHFSSGKIDQVSIEYQRNTKNNYDGVMCKPFWFLIPAGQPVHAHIENAETVKVQQDDQFIFTRQLKGKTLTLTLEQQYDYLPSTVRIAASEESWMEAVAEDYQEAGGHWFPVKGRVERRSRPGSKIPSSITTFVVTELKVNENVPNDVFVAPLSQDGIVVRDTIQGKNRIVGGPEARVKLVELETARLAAEGEADVLSRSSGPVKTIHLALGIAVSGLLGLGVLIFKAVRRDRR